MDVNEAEAQKWFKSVSYYRLSAYWYPAREFDASGKFRLDTFREGISFTDVANLYEADRKLRTLVHDGMERVEVAMRTLITETLCSKNPSNPAFYIHSNNFRPKFDHAAWVHTVYGRISRARRNESVKHYSRNYGGTFPLWVVAEVLDFSDISKLYAGLLSTDQRAIAEELNLFIAHDNLSGSQKDKLRKSHPLTGWLEQLTVIRNTCAHHSRLWNKSFAPASTDLIRANGNLKLLPSGQNERIFGALVFMAHILDYASPGSSWSTKVVRLINEEFLPNPLVEPEALGIPSNWDKKTL